MSFVRKHVAQHLQPNWPWLCPAISAKRLDAAPALAERFMKHLRAAGGALSQPRAGLLRRATRAIQLCWNVQMWSRQSDPLAADIVHVREDRRDGADRTRRFGSPEGRLEMLDKNLVQAIAGREDLACNPAGLNLLLTRRHGFLLPVYVTTSATPVSDMCLSVDQHVSVRRFFIITSPCASARVRFWSLNFFVIAPAAANCSPSNGSMVRRGNSSTNERNCTARP